MSFLLQANVYRERAKDHGRIWRTVGEFESKTAAEAEIPVNNASQFRIIDTESKDYVGVKIKNILAERKMTAHRAAKLCNVDAASIRRYISGDQRPVRKTLERIAEGLKLPKNYFEEVAYDRGS